MEEYTPLIDGDSYLVKLPGYEFKNCDSPTAAGGVGIYIRENLNFDVRDDLKLDIDNCEDKWIEINVNSSKQKSKGAEKIVIGIIYRHPGNNFKLFQDKLSGTIYELNKKKRTL